MNDQNGESKPRAWRHPAREWTLVLEEPMCRRLRELPDWADQPDDEVALGFLKARGERWADEIENVPDGSEIRVIVDTFSRQAFLVHGQRVVHLESF